MLLKLSPAFVTILIFLMAARPQARKETNPSLQATDITTFEVRPDLTTKARNEMIAKIRTWLWDHWQDRRTGRMEMMTTTLEGENTRTIFSVEQSPEGVWHIAFRSARLLKDSRYPGQVFPESSDTDAYELDRVRVRMQGAGKKASPISPAEQLDAERYRLVFRDKSGKALFDL